MLLVQFSVFTMQYCFAFQCVCPSVELHRGNVLKMLNTLLSNQCWLIVHSSYRQKILVVSKNDAGYKHAADQKLDLI